MFIIASILLIGEVSADDGRYKAIDCLSCCDENSYSNKLQEEETKDEATNVNDINRNNTGDILDNSEQILNVSKITKYLNTINLLLIGLLALLAALFITIIIMYRNRKNNNINSKYAEEINKGNYNREELEKIISEIVDKKVKELSIQINKRDKTETKMPTELEDINYPENDGEAEVPISPIALEKFEQKSAAASLPNSKKYNFSTQNRIFAKFNEYSKEKLVEIVTL